MAGHRKLKRGGWAVLPLLLAALPAGAQVTGADDTRVSGDPGEPQPQVQAPETGDSDIVRLPGRGEVKVESPLLSRKDRLAPGGGLLVSFDANGDGALSPAEFETGLRTAFETADSNGNGQLSVFEQLDWADSLPTRDGSLSNPVRFDPNLDRMVSDDEFSAVIRSLAAPYTDPETGMLDLAKLKRTEPADRPDDEARDGEVGLGQGRGRETRMPRPTRSALD